MIWLISIVAVIAIAGVALGGYAWNNTTYAARDLQHVRDAGFSEARVTLPSGTELNYAEGPDNGPAVLLLHGQGGAWESYARALPELAKQFHVYAIDVAGHGDSARTPGRYNVDDLGQDAVDFIREVIRTPVILSGHSSGGLMAAWVAAAAPEQVRGVVFEDPPFFSTDPERMPQQFNYVDLAKPAHEYLAQDSVDDFASWYIEHNGWIGYFGGGRDGIVKYAKSYRQKHPDQPMSIWFLPPKTNESFAYMHEFDPAFADAFYTLQWQEGFDQAATLEKVTQPSILVHANWRARIPLRKARRFRCAVPQDSRPRHALRRPVLHGALTCSNERQSPLVVRRDVPGRDLLRGRVCCAAGARIAVAGSAVDGAVAAVSGGLGDV